jgi:hypothetical protein
MHGDGTRTWTRDLERPRVCQARGDRPVAHPKFRLRGQVRAHIAGTPRPARPGPRIQQRPRDDAEGLGLRRRQGAHDHPAGNEPAAQRPAVPAQPAAAGLDQLLPARGLKQSLLLPEPLHVAPGHQMAAPQASRAQLEAVPPSMPPFGVVADGGPGDASTRQRCRPPDTAIGAQQYRRAGPLRHERQRRPSLGFVESRMP